MDEPYEYPIVQGTPIDDYYVKTNGRFRKRSIIYIRKR